MNYYLLVNGQQTGPFSLEQLAVTGISPDTMVWTEGMADWQPAWQVSDLSSVLTPAEAPQAAPMAPNAPAYEAQTAVKTYEPAPEPPRKKSRTGLKVLLGILIFLIVAAGVLFFTNPSKEKHMEKLQAVMTEAMNTMNTDGMDSETKLGMQMGMGLITKMFDQMFEYHNYGLWSTVTVKESGEKISTGFLTMVNISNKEEIMKGMNDLNKLGNLDDDDDEADIDDDDTATGSNGNSFFDDDDAVGDDGDFDLDDYTDDDDDSFDF